MPKGSRRNKEGCAAAAIGVVLLLALIIQLFIRIISS